MSNLRFMSKFPCPNCSSEMSSNSLVCSKCGHKLKLEKTLFEHTNQEIIADPQDTVQSTINPDARRVFSSESMKEVLAQAELKGKHHSGQESFTSRHRSNSKKRGKIYLFFSIVVVVGITIFVEVSQFGFVKDISQMFSSNSSTSKTPSGHTLSKCETLDLKLLQLKTKSKSTFVSFSHLRSEYAIKKAAIVTGQDLNDTVEISKKAYSAQVKLHISYLDEISAAREAPGCWKADIYTTLETAQVVRKTLVDYETSFTKSALFKIMLQTDAQGRGSGGILSRESFMDVLAEFRSSHNTLPRANSTKAPSVTGTIG